MLYLDGAVGLALLALWIFCIIDVICAPETACRNLPKLLWLLIVVFLPTIGSILWLFAGRPRATAAPRSGFYRGAEPRGFPEYERLGRSTASSSEADAEFLRRCRERAEQQRAVHEQRQRDDNG